MAGPLSRQLSIVKPVDVRWTIELYDYFKSRPEQCDAGIYDSIFNAVDSQVRQLVEIDSEINITIHDKIPKQAGIT